MNRLIFCSADRVVHECKLRARFHHHTKPKPPLSPSRPPSAPSPTLLPPPPAPASPPPRESSPAFSYTPTRPTPSPRSTKSPPPPPPRSSPPSPHTSPPCTHTSARGSTETARSPPPRSAPQDPCSDARYSSTRSRPAPRTTRTCWCPNIAWWAAPPRRDSRRDPEWVRARSWVWARRGWARGAPARGRRAARSWGRWSRRRACSRWWTRRCRGGRFGGRRWWRSGFVRCCRRRSRCPTWSRRS
mmetsp:Transcript_15582/g.39881  ORF Transcript_15582/g.39881 Transcript_15582/m.39881 type:complete len:244 (+) Transcript_15582:250-981(+)